MGEHQSFLKHFVERSIFILYISCMYVIVFQRKPNLHLVNRFNSLKHVQHFQLRERKGKKKEKKNIARHLQNYEKC